MPGFFGSRGGGMKPGMSQPVNRGGAGPQLAPGAYSGVRGISDEWTGSAQDLNGMPGSMQSGAFSRYAENPEVQAMMRQREWQRQMELMGFGGRRRTPSMGAQSTPGMDSALSLLSMMGSGGGGGGGYSGGSMRSGGGGGY